MSFERNSAPALNYDCCRYGASRLGFRGPKRSLDGPYVAFLGGTETFGRCIPDPFPSLVEQETGSRCLNLGLPNAGVDAFIADPEVAHLLSGARLSVVQVLGAVNMSNRFYRVHPRRNDRFVAASSAMAEFYHAVDFTEFTFNRHMLRALLGTDPDRFVAVRDELRIAWTARMRTLLGLVKGPAVLLWIRLPANDPLGEEPLMVTREMVEDVRDLVCDVVEVRAERAGGNLQGMVVGPTERPLAAHLAGVDTHARIAARLAPIVG